MKASGPFVRRVIRARSRLRSPDDFDRCPPARRRPRMGGATASLSCSRASRGQDLRRRRVGLWTKADSVIHFDAIVIARLDRAGKGKGPAGEIRAGITFALGPWAAYPARVA